MLDWPLERANFSHRDLRNTFIVDINTAISVCERGAVSDLVVDVEKLIALWGGYSKTAEGLIKRCRDEMSPRVLFRQPPLANLDEADQVILSDMAHELWLKRYDIETLLLDARKLRIAIDTVVKKLAGMLDLPDVDRHDWKAELTSLYENATALSEELSTLPHEILV